MINYRMYSLLLIIPLFCMCSSPKQEPVNKSQWVYEGSDGKLVYKTTEKGDRIMDFSHAGYMCGGVALPDVPVKITILPSPNGEDMSAGIQAAIDSVSKMALENGLRGAVLLIPGVYNCSKTISILADGVVLRGSGSGTGGTTIRMIGERHPAFIIGSDRRDESRSIDNSEAEKDDAEIPEYQNIESYITDEYVGAGAQTFNVFDVSGFAEGDIIKIDRPVTSAWLHFMKMDSMTRDGKPLTWVREGSIISQYREITHIEGNNITIKEPLADSYDLKFMNAPGVKIIKASPVQAIICAGVENLHVQCPPLEIAYGKAPYSGAKIGGNHCWIRDVFFEETMNTIDIDGNNNTIQHVRVFHTFPNLGASKPADFSFNGTMNLVDRCESTGGNTYFVWTSSRNPGPNVTLNSTFKGHGSRLQPHQRWATGLLFDNCTILDGGIDFMNRGAAGSGHGWTMGWGVAWNCIAKNYAIQNPPGVKNWAIGCIGEKWIIPALFNTAPVMSDGEYDSFGQPVYPQSLYLAQLKERLGMEAIRNIGYASNDINEFENKNEQSTAPLKQEMDPVLGADLGLFRPINADNEREGSRIYAAEKANDADENTYWATEDGVTMASLTIDTEGPLDINAVMIDERDAGENRILEYKLESQTDSDWTLLARGTTIGKNKIERFDKITVWKVRLTITKAEKSVAVNKLGLYLEKR